MRTNLVTISRQFASGGSYISQQAAQRLGMKHVDREILRLAAADLGNEETDLSGREERLSTFWERFGRTVTSGMADGPYVVPPILPPFDRDLFETETMIIREIAAIYNAVIVGRGATFILKGRPGLASVFIHASQDFRIKRAMDVYKISTADQARSTIKALDRQKEEFVRTMLGASWTDARNYHLCIDSSAVGLDAAVEMVVGLAQAASAAS